MSKGSFLGDLFGGPSLTGVARRKIGMLNKTEVMEVVAVLISQSVVGLHVALCVNVSIFTYNHCF